MPSVFTLFGELKADTKSFENSMRAAEALSKKTAAEIGKVEQKAAGMGKTSATTARQIEKLRERQAATNKMLSDAVSAFNRGDVTAKRFGSTLASVSTRLEAVGSRSKDMAARLQDAANKTLGFSTRMGATVVAGNLLASAVAGLSSRLQDGAASVFNYAARLQNAKVSLTNLTGSAVQAKTILAELQQFARSSPFEFSGLQSVATRLAGVGINTQKVIPLMRDLGNIVAATGDVSTERFEGIANAIAQMISKTRVSAEEMEQLAERGVPAWKLLSEATGQPIAELRKLSEQGKITSDSMIEALSRIAQTKYGDAMAEQSKTAQGAWNVLTNALSESLNTAFAPVFREISAQLSQYASNIQKAENDTGGWANTTSNVLAGVIKSWKEATSAVENYLIAQGYLTQKQEESVSWARKLLASGALGEYFFRTGEEANKAAEDIEAFNAALKGTMISARTWKLDPVTNTIQQLDQAVAETANKMPSAAQKVTNQLQISLTTGLIGVKGTAQAQSQGVGSAMGLGLAMGLSSMVGRVVAQAYDLAESAWLAMKRAVNSNSPAKKTIELGEDIGKGLEIGMRSRIVPITVTAKEIAKAVLDEFKSLGDSVKSDLLKKAAILSDFGKYFALRQQASDARKFTDELESTIQKALELGITLKSLADLEAFRNVQKVVSSVDALRGNAPALPDVSPLTASGTIGGNDLGGLEIGSIGDAGESAATAWDTFFTMFSTRLNEIKSSLPSFKESLTVNLLESAGRIGDIFANAVEQWDGTMQGFFRSIASGFAQLAKQIISELIRIAVMQAVLKLVGLFAGAAFGGGASAGPASGAAGSAGGAGHGLFSGLTQTLSAAGKGLASGLSGLAGGGLTPSFAGASSIMNDNRTNNNFTFNVSGGGQGIDARTRQQMISEFTSIIRQHEMRKK